MGKLLDSMLSGSYGRTGRLVVANVSGTEILKTRPRRKTVQAPSPKQALIQERMKRAYKFMLPYKGYAERFFGIRTGMKSPYSQAMSNLLLAFKLNFTTMQIEPAYPEIEFSKGDLLGAVPTGLTSPTTLSFTVTWFNNSGADPLRETDELQLLYFAEGEPQSVFMENAALRTDGDLVVPVAPNLQTKKVHVWIAFRSADLAAVSISSYVGMVTIT